MIWDTPFQVTAPRDRSPLANNSLPLCHFLPKELLHFIYLLFKSLSHNDRRRSLGVNRKLRRGGKYSDLGRQGSGEEKSQKQFGELEECILGFPWHMFPEPGKACVLFILRAWGLDFGSDRRLRGTISINNTLKNLELLVDSLMINNTPALHVLKLLALCRIDQNSGNC